MPSEHSSLIRSSAMFRIGSLPSRLVGLQTLARLGLVRENGTGFVDFVPKVVEAVEIS
ncbi:MAG: hypothetical protein ACLP7Q_08385 [Isosphaeraceae bacterium]